jgi:uncharacterized protein (TIGR02246 family)
MRYSISLWLLATAATAMALGGCTNSNPLGGGSNPDKVKKAIAADEAKWNQQFKAKDTEGLVDHYADNAYFIVPGMAGAEGSTPIRQAYANASTDPAFEVHFSSDKIDASGDLAYARGHFDEKYTDKKTGKVMADSGSYLTVYKKQDDGSWKAVEDFAAADPDSTKPVPPGKPATRAKMTSF